MDRFKFRGKRADNGEWVIGSAGENDNSQISLILEPCDGYFECYEVESKTIGQCTGLKDKNGKLAFESDTWKDDKGNNGVIKWDKGAYCFDFGIYGSVYDQEGCPMEDGEFEITGSIHDEN